MKRSILVAVCLIPVFVLTYGLIDVLKNGSPHDREQKQRQQAIDAFTSSPQWIHIKEELAQRDNDPKFTNTVLDDIINKKVCIDMPKDAALLALGSPTSVTSQPDYNGRNVERLNYDVAIVCISEGRVSEIHSRY